MTRTQIESPAPLYSRLKEIAEMNDWSLAEVVRRASELYARRFAEGPEAERQTEWSLPVVDMGGDFLAEPADICPEADAVEARSR